MNKTTSTSMAATTLAEHRANAGLAVLLKDYGREMVMAMDPDKIRVEKGDPGEEEGCPRVLASGGARYRSTAHGIPWQIEVDRGFITDADVPVEIQSAAWRIVVRNWQNQQRAPHTQTPAHREKEKVAA